MSIYDHYILYHCVLPDSSFANLKDPPISRELYLHA